MNDWSLKAQNVITARRSPASSEYLLALAPAAMYDAVVAIEGEYRPFRVSVEVDHPASPGTAAAAYHVWAEHTAVQWNRNLRQLAAAAQLDVVDTARMLAMVHVASADATVGCFEAKYSFLLSRPVPAISVPTRTTIPERRRT